MEVLPKFFISGNTPSSKNSRRWTGKYFIVSKLTAAWRKNTEHEWLSQRLRFLSEVAKLSPPYYVELTFIRDSRRRFDYINIAQGVMDAMKNFGWISDDDSQNTKPYFGDPVYDKLKPGVIITILKEKPQHYDIQKYTRGS